ncbi:MAG: DUF2267 domain-containing protein [Oscillochloris sp.]|nr:DUF2267 domain-containing protein [Oscillochloris sp.]
MSQTLTLVQLLQERVGISEQQAQQAVQVISGFLKDRLPEPIAGQIDGVLNGADISGVAGMLGGLGGMFGKKE